MSRLLAAAGGLTYDLPQDSLARQMAMPPVKGGTSGASGAGRGENLDPISKLMEEELYQQEGMTQEYFNEAAALQTFAKQAASAGIDVTRVDYSNPQSIKYHNIYQQGIASLYNKKNQLTRLRSFEDESLKSPNIVRRFDEQGNPFFAQTGQSAIVRQFEEVSKQVQSEEELAQFNQMKAREIQALQSDLANASNPRERQEIQSQIQQLSAVTPGIGISPADRARMEQDESQFNRNLEFQQRKLAAELAQKREEVAAKKGDDKPFFRVSNLAGMIESGDVSQMVATSGVASPGFSDALGGRFFSYTDPSGYKREIKIDLLSDEGLKKSIAAMNSVVNSGPGSEGGGDVSNEDLLNVLNKLDGKELTEFRKSLIKQWYGEDATEEDVDLTGPIKDVLKSSVKKGGSTDEYKRLINVLSTVEDGYVPSSAMKKGKLKGNYYLESIEADLANSVTRFLGASDDIKINVYNDKGEETSITLELNNEEDLAILRDIIDENIDLLPRDVVSRLTGG